ncbi:unnamed protein product [Pseudo-nitzschia multistriata]|uniref:Uncharacterized protein n=1 Tax=Pseudo-nitzschia multistriata TaxID=183589 RepID=A0A448ZQA9_9STRA|nr:unnamed protein product [Pseudo-nitzschia multistriata]
MYDGPTTQTPPTTHHYGYNCCGDFSQPGMDTPATVDPSPLNLLSSAASALSAQSTPVPPRPSANHRWDDRSPSPPIHTTSPFSNGSSSPSSTRCPRTRNNTAILAVFPKLPSSSVAPSFSMQPGMEIRVSHLPNIHLQPRSKSYTEMKPAASSKKRDYKYRMRYSSLSMTRAAAHRYIADLERASNYGLRAVGNSSSGYMNCTIYPEAEYGAYNAHAYTIPSPVPIRATKGNISPTLYPYNSTFEPHYQTYVQYG